MFATLAVASFGSDLTCMYPLTCVTSDLCSDLSGVEGLRQIILSSFSSRLEEVCDLFDLSAVT